MKVYGPYHRKDGRQHVIIIDDNGKRRTVSYPKFLMEQKLGRELDPELETVDHFDDDFTNNDENNLRILTRKQHTKEDARRVQKVDVKCVWCGKEFQRTARIIHNSHSRQCAGPFCSNECKGQYGSSLQNGYCERLEIQPSIPREQRKYFKTKRRNTQTG